MAEAARSNKGASLKRIVGFVLVGAALVCAAAADGLAPYDPRSIQELPPEWSGRYASVACLPPSFRFPLGTDGSGRDLLSRVIYGARTSLAAGAASIAVALSLGAGAGLAAGVLGGWVDQILSRGLDLFMSIPPVLVALLTWVALGAGWSAVMLAVGVINIPLFFRLVRAGAEREMLRDYVQASRSMGATDLHVVWHAVLPALRGPLIVACTLGLGTAILETAGLAFLGLAGEIDVPEWGAMLSEAKNDLGRSVWVALAPGAAVSGVVLGFNLLGDALRDAVEKR